MSRIVHGGCFGLPSGRMSTLVPLGSVLMSGSCSCGPISLTPRRSTVAELRGREEAWGGCECVGEICGPECGPEGYGA